MKKMMFVAAIATLLTQGALAVVAQDLVGVYAGKSVTNDTHCQASVYQNGADLEIRVQDQYNDLSFPPFPAEKLTQAIAQGYQGAFFVKGPETRLDLGEGEDWALNGSLREDGTIRFITVSQGHTYNSGLAGQTNVICQVKQKVAN